MAYLNDHTFIENPFYDYDDRYESFIKDQLYEIYCERYGEYIDPKIFEEWIYEDNLDEFEIDHLIAQNEEKVCVNSKIM